MAMSRVAVVDMHRDADGSYDEDEETDEADDGIHDVTHRLHQSIR